MESRSVIRITKIDSSQARVQRSPVEIPDDTDARFVCRHHDTVFSGYLQRRYGWSVAGQGRLKAIPAQLAQLQKEQETKRADRVLLAVVFCLCLLSFDSQTTMYEIDCECNNGWRVWWRISRNSTIDRLECLAWYIRVVSGCGFTWSLECWILCTWMKPASEATNRSRQFGRPAQTVT